LLRRIDELHLELPYYGSTQAMFTINKEGRRGKTTREKRMLRGMGSELVSRASAFGQHARKQAEKEKRECVDNANAT
jgi:hypothetical protein